MGGINQTSYLTDDQGALYWWKNLGDGYLISRILRNKELRPPNDFEPNDLERGINWLVTTHNAENNVILVCSWKQKENSSVCRVDIRWPIDIFNVCLAKDCLSAIENALVVSSAKLIPD